MTHHNDVPASLHRLVELLRERWYRSGRGDEFEELVERYRENGNWPFGC